MTGTRPYRDSISTQDALAELRSQAGTQFDARWVEALAEVVQDAPATPDGLPRLPAELQRASSRAQSALPGR